MLIVFKQTYLSDLYYGTDNKKHRFQPDVIKKYIKTVNILKQAKRVEDLFPFHSLNYEKLKGNRFGIESVRVTDKYRLEIKTEETEGDPLITICNILELSNHYK